MKMIRFVGSWALFILGDLVGRTMRPRFQRFTGHLYPIYNWMMCKSSDIQGRGKGPWSAIEGDE